MNTISPTVTIVSAILIVVVLIIAFSLRGKIKRTERGNEFFPWERDAAQGNEVLSIRTDDDDYEDEMNETEEIEYNNEKEDECEDEEDD